MDKNSIKKELAAYLIDMINEGVLTNENCDDWNHVAFNQTYYVIDNHVAKKWMEKHEVDVFGGMKICQKWEKETLGEVHTEYSGWEDVVNMIVFVIGWELLGKAYPAETVEALAEFLRETIQNLPMGSN